MIEEETMLKKPDARLRDPDLEPADPKPTKVDEKSSRRLSRTSILGAVVLLLLPGSLIAGAYRHYKSGASVAATAQQHRDFVPAVRVAAVRPSDGMMTVSLPATTTAFEAANIF